MAPPRLAFANEWAAENDDDREWIVRDKLALLHSYWQLRKHRSVEKDHARGEEREKEASFTMSDLIALLERLPEVDSDLADDLDAAIKLQPKLSPSTWEP